jgi:hypothetical protein
MNAPAWIVTAAVAGLLGLVALDIYRTVLHSRGSSGPVTEALIRAVWRLARAAAFRRSRPGRHYLLNHVGPLLLPGTVATLVALIILGYALLYWPHLPAGFNVDEKAQSARGIEALYTREGAAERSLSRSLLEVDRWCSSQLSLKGVVPCYPYFCFFH